ncbi:hypothetical protein BG023_111007 [Porphyrobacter sp. LM 6]|nr:hypothetical protein BG023_111007 [Porphyrobacter sp. LM 6]
MRKARGLHDFRVKAMLCRLDGLLSYAMFGQASANLRNLVGVLLPSVEDVQLTGTDDLSDACQTVKCR